MFSLLVCLALWLWRPLRNRMIRRRRLFRMSVSNPRRSLNLRGILPFVKLEAFAIFFKEMASLQAAAVHCILDIWSMDIFSDFNFSYA